MVLGTMVFFYLKNKYVVTPEGRPIGGLPSKNDASDFEDGESQKAVFSKNALIGAVVAFIGLGFLFHYAFGQNIIYAIIYAKEEILLCITGESLFLLPLI